jgi:hypothetical protein
MEVERITSGWDRACGFSGTLFETTGDSREDVLWKDSF